MQNIELKIPMYNSQLPQRFGMYNPLTNELESYLGQRGLMGNYSSSTHHVVIPGVGFVPIITQSSLPILKMDGTIQVLPAVTDSTVHLGDASADGSTLVLMRTSTTAGYNILKVYDVVNNTLLGEYTLAEAYGYNVTYTSISVNSDGSKVAVSKTGGQPTVFNTSDGSVDWTPAGVLLRSNLFYDSADNLWMSTDTNTWDKYDATGTLVQTVTTPWEISTSTNGARINLDRTELIINPRLTSDFSILLNLTTGVIDPNFTWDYPGGAPLFITNDEVFLSGTTQAHITRRDPATGEWSEPEFLGPLPSSSSFIAFQAIMGTSYFVSGTISGVHSETKHLVSVYGEDNTLENKVILGNGETDFKLRVDGNSNKMVVITSAPRRGIEVDTQYAVGDEVLVNDTYVFTCTASGTTTKLESLPSSGTFTYGTAEFTYLSKLIKPNVNYPVVPTP